MAEVLGVVASGIAVVQMTTEIGGAVVKLKRLWDRVEQVPHQIRDILSDMTVLEPLLAEIQREFKSSELPEGGWNSSLASQSASYCTQAQKTLIEMVEELDGRIMGAKSKTRQMARAAKVLMRKDDLDRMQERLRSALDMLQLSVNLYTAATNKYTNQIIRQNNILLQEWQVGQTVKDGRLTNGGDEEHHQPDAARAMKTLSISQISNWMNTKRRSYQPTYFGRLAFEYSANRRSLIASFQPPTWLAQTVWEFGSRRALSGWDVHLRSYNIVSNKAPAMECIRRDDLETLLELFDRREASPFDRDEGGWTLLHYALRYYKPRICKKLLEVGLHKCIYETARGRGGSRRQFTPFTGISTPFMDGRYAMHLIWDPEEQLQMLSLFDSYESYLGVLGDDDLMKMFPTLPAETFPKFQQEFLPHYYTLPARQHFFAARMCCWPTSTYAVSPAPRLIRQATRQNGIIEADDIDRSVREGLSLLHTAAIALGMKASSKYLYNSFVNARDSVSEYSALVCELVTALGRADLLSVGETVQCGCPSRNDENTHPWPSWTGTPMMSLIRSVFCGMCRDTMGQRRMWKNACDDAIKTWLDALKSCGVDLRQYGNRELETFLRLDGAAGSRCDFSLPRDYLEECTPLQLDGIVYGPEPDDWLLIWSESRESYAHDFWQMVELEPRPNTQRVPGGWVD